MAVLEIHKFPARILTKLAGEITNIDGRIAGLLNSMVDTMYAAKGIGLAAPQIGALERALDTLLTQRLLLRQREAKRFNLLL